MNKASVSLLLIGGPGDAMIYSIDATMRQFEFVESPRMAPAAPGEAVRYERVAYAIIPIYGKHHEVFRVGVRTMNECPLLALLTNYRTPKGDDGDEWAAQNHVTLIGGDGDGCHVHVPFSIETVTLAFGTYHVEQVSHNGNTYRVGLADPNACPFKALMLGYRKE
jgi:hypothetical protein